MSFPIGEAAEKSGCTPPTIRYYESIDLIAPAARSMAGRRAYGSQDVARLTFIRRARDFGMGIAQVRALLDAAEAPASACATARPVVEDHLRSLRAKRAELKALETALTAILARCDAGCSGVNPGPCAIYDGFQWPGGKSDDDALDICRRGPD